MPRGALPQAARHRLHGVRSAASSGRSRRRSAISCESRRFLTATAFSLIAVALIAQPAGIAAISLSAIVVASLLAFLFLVLRARQLVAAIGGTAVLAAAAVALVPLEQQEWFRSWIRNAWSLRQPVDAMIA